MFIHAVVNVIEYRGKEISYNINLAGEDKMLFDQRSQSLFGNAHTMKKVYLVIP